MNLHCDYLSHPLHNNFLPLLLPTATITLSYICYFYCYMLRRVFALLTSLLLIHITPPFTGNPLVKSISSQQKVFEHLTHSIAFHFSFIHSALHLLVSAFCLRSSHIQFDRCAAGCLSISCSFRLCSLTDYYYRSYRTELPLLPAPFWV
jgi:hypothetical protein